MKNVRRIFAAIHDKKFSDGDRLKVHLQTTAKRMPQGNLKVERRIPTVLDVEHVRHKKRSYSKKIPDS
jgi:hypothetical protein